MINKVYGKIKKFIKENYKSIIIYLVLFVVLTYPLPYYIYTGGGIINLEDRVSVENEYKEKGSFNLAYVRNVSATIPTYLLSYVFNWDRENISDYKIDENDNNDAIWEREKLYLQESIDNATINAYRLANEEITINKKAYKVLNINPEAMTNLKVGDYIVSIDGKEIKEYSDITDSVVGKEIGDELTIVVSRDNKEINCYAKVIMPEEKKMIGIYLIKSYDYDVKRKIDFNFSNREGGSSGGFMLSLAIYNRLVEKDLTNGLKIVGTGTIDSDGNIGSIGGVKYKLKGAVSKKADIFFVPSGENYEEAMKEKTAKKYKIEIVEVTNLKDAIDYLESR